MALILLAESKRKLKKEIKTNILDLDVALKNAKPLFKKNAVVLAVCAHPDDLEYFCGGTIAKAIKSGVKIHACIATDGAKGGVPLLSMGRAKKRVKEQILAKKIIKYASLHFLNFPDTKLRKHTVELTQNLAKLIAKLKPSVLLTFDPVFKNPTYHHKDHIACGQIASELFGETKTIKTMAFFDTSKPNAVVDIANEIDSKTSAFLCHRSQMHGIMRVSKRHLISRARATGKAVGCEFAEVLRVESKH